MPGREGADEGVPRTRGVNDGRRCRGDADEPVICRQAKRARRAERNHDGPGAQLTQAPRSLQTAGVVLGQHAAHNLALGLVEADKVHAGPEVVRHGSRRRRVEDCVKSQLVRNVQGELRGDGVALALGDEDIVLLANATQVSICICSRKRMVGAGVENDAAIVFATSDTSAAIDGTAATGDYVLTVMTSDVNDSAAAQASIRDLSGAVWNAMRE